MIVQKYPHLMAPFSVKGVHFKNHIFLAPCALSHVTYGAPNDLGIEYIEEKARGGVAQITQGNITGPGGYGDNGGHFNRYFTNCFTDMHLQSLQQQSKNTVLCHQQRLTMQDLWLDWRKIPIHRR